MLRWDIKFSHSVLLVVVHDHLDVCCILGKCVKVYAEGTLANSKKLVLISGKRYHDHCCFSWQSRLSTQLYTCRYVETRTRNQLWLDRPDHHMDHVFLIKSQNGQSQQSEAIIIRPLYYTVPVWYFHSDHRGLHTADLPTGGGVTHVCPVHHAVIIHAKKNTQAYGRFREAKCGGGDLFRKIEIFT